MNELMSTPEDGEQQIGSVYECRASPRPYLTSYASLVSQLTTLEKQYKMLKTTSPHFSIKQQWQTTASHAENANVATCLANAGIRFALTTHSTFYIDNAWKTARFR